MNVFTFVKEVYSSLKHITNKLHSNETKTDLQYNKLEQKISSLEAKLDYNKQELHSIKDMIHNYYNSDQSIGNDIQQKMENLLSTTEFNQEDNKLNLKPEELTLANVDENNYSFNDIQNSFDTGEIVFNPNLTEELLNSDTNLFSSINFDEEFDEELNEELNEESNRELNKNKTTEENITDLVF